METDVKKQTPESEELLPPPYTPRQEWRAPVSALDPKLKFSPNAHGETLNIKIRETVGMGLP